MSDYIPSPGEIDYVTKAGARELQNKLKDFWRDPKNGGHRINTGEHNNGFHPAIREARFDVRSDMINGLPRQEYERRLRLLSEGRPLLPGLRKAA